MGLRSTSQQQRWLHILLSSWDPSRSDSSCNQLNIYMSITDTIHNYVYKTPVYSESSTSLIWSVDQEFLCTILNLWVWTLFLNPKTRYPLIQIFLQQVQILLLLLRRLGLKFEGVAKNLTRVRFHIVGHGSKISNCSPYWMDYKVIPSVTVVPRYRLSVLGDKWQNSTIEYSHCTM